MDEVRNDLEFTRGYAPPRQSEATKEAVPTKPRPGFIASTRRGAKTGFRRGSYVAGPFAAIFIVAGLALLLFGLGTGRGLGLPVFAVVASGLWIGFGLACGVLGGTVCLLQRAIPTPHERSRWGILNRPLPFLDKPRDRMEQTGVGDPAERSYRLVWMSLIAAPMLLACLGAFGLGVYWGQIIDARLAEALAATENDDPNWRLGDLMAHRAAVPDEENSAIVVAKVTALLPMGWPDDPPPPVGSIKPPASGLSDTYQVLVSAQANVRLEDRVVEILRKETRRRHEAIRIARTVAGYPRGRHELQIPENTLETRLAETQASRTAARLLEVDASIAVHEGDPEMALEDCRAILGVARSIGDEPFAISQLMRLAIGRNALKCVRRVLAQAEPSDPAMASLQAAFLEEMGQTQAVFIQACRGERAERIELFRRLGDGEAPLDEWVDFVPAYSWNSSKYSVSPWMSLYYDSQRAAAANWMNELVNIVHKPVPERELAWDLWENELQGTMRDSLEAFLQGTAIRLIPAIRPSEIAQSRYEAELGAMVVLLAAERHRRTEGKWPESIEEIDKKLLPVRPHDPFSGAAYLMTATGSFIR